MKLKALLLALCTAGIAVSVAVAAAPAEKGKGRPGGGEASTVSSETSTGTQAGHGQDKANGKARSKACRPARKLVLHGAFVAAGAGGFALSVEQGNHGAKAFFGKQVSVLVDEKTHVHGAKQKLADLAAGDRLVVQGYACKADAAAASLLARKVGVKGAKAPGKDEVQADDAKDDDDPTTGGTTTGS